MENLVLFSQFTDEKLFILDLIICIVLIISFTVLLFIYSKKNYGVFIVCGSLALSAICLIFGLTLTGIITLLISIILCVTFMFTNIAEFRRFFIKSNPTSIKKSKTSAKVKKEELYRIIDSTVHSLSRSKTGAIITFERNTNMDDIIKSGTIINAPVTQELLETIFYKGTRLHDGAVVIRGNMILAASVYYTPTTRALTGKYGSRHRAAFGISEITDSVTVVVSEETGRISIAYNGNLESVSVDSFLREFTDLMSIDN